MKLGQRATVTRRFEPETLAAFARLTGIDTGAMVPEPLIGALFSYLLGVELPGAGTNYLKQDLAFLKPVPADAALTATVEITRLRPEKHLVDLTTTCTDDGGEVVCRGRALVMVKDADG